jgi:hypothetical protein
MLHSWLLRSLVLFLVISTIACGSGSSDDGSPAAGAPTALPPAELPATATPAATPTPVTVRRDIQATRLTIPSLAIDAPVQESRTVPYTYVPPPGCPPRPDDTSTVTVPNQGIATPVDNLEGMENKAWIYGHSRWLGVQGLLFAIQDLGPGDEVVVDGVDRATGQRLERQRFLVDGLYLTDVDSGGTLINATKPADIPAKPLVILQTSVREDGAGKQWILDRDKLLSKAKNLVQGDLNDPCKYLLLFVFATSAA